MNRWPELIRPPIERLNGQNGQFAQIRKLNRMLEGSDMTKQDWTYVEERLKKQFAIVVLNCDGYRLSLTLGQIREMELAICIYINGQMKGVWLNECEERRRFFRPMVRHVYSQKARKDMVKNCGKRWLKSKGFDVDETYTVYIPFWKSFRSLKSHLIKNNTSIELVAEAP